MQTLELITGTICYWIDRLSVPFTLIGAGYFLAHLINYIGG